MSSEYHSSVSPEEMLSQLMKCANCDLVTPASPSYYFCEQEGHLLCSVCGTRSCCPLDQCQILQCPFQLYDDLYNESEFTCMYREYGCTDIVKGSQIKDHEETCLYRPMATCAFSKCKLLLTKHEYLEHLQHIHNVGIHNSAIGSIGIHLDSLKTAPSTEVIRCVSSIFNCWDNHFFLTVEKANKVYTIWVNSFDDIGTKDFGLVLKVHGQEGEHGIEKRLKIHSHNVSSLEVKNSGQYISITHDDLSKYLMRLEGCGDTDYLRTDVRILKLRQRRPGHIDPTLIFFDQIKEEEEKPVQDELNERESGPPATDSDSSVAFYDAVGKPNSQFNFNFLEIQSWNVIIFLGVIALGCFVNLLTHLF